MSVGFLGHLMLKQETSFGTEATPDVALEIKSEAVTEDDTLIMPDYVNNRRSKSRAIQGRYTAGGGIDFDLMPVPGLGWLFKGVFGQVSTSAVPATSTTYDHTFTPIQSTDLPSYSVEVAYGNDATKWIGSTFNTLNVGITPDGLLESSVELIAQTSKDVAPQTPTFTNIDPWSPYQAAFTLGGASNSNFEDFNFSITNDVEPVGTLDGNRWDGKHTAKGMAITGSVTMEFEDMTHRAQFYGAAGATTPQETVFESSVTMTLTHAEETESGYYYTITLTLPKVVFHTVPVNIGGANDRILEVINWEAYRPDTATQLVTLVLRDATSTYA